MKERPVLESIIAEIHRRADKEWAREGHDFAVWITADEYKALCEEEIMMAQEEVGEGVPDYINDAIDNLAHDNYRTDYAGYLERKKDIALIRAYIARSEQPAEQQLSPDVPAQMDRLFCDLKTDKEKAAFFLSGRGYESGVIAHSVQNDVAMAYLRCSEYRKEIAALQAECEKLRERMAEVKELLGFYLNGGSNYRADAERAEEIINEASAGGRHEPRKEL